MPITETILIQIDNKNPFFTKIDANNIGKIQINIKNPANAYTFNCDQNSVTVTGIPIITPDKLIASAITGKIKQLPNPIHNILEPCNFLNSVFITLTNGHTSRQS